MEHRPPEDVSVVIPCGKLEGDLVRCVESAAAQRPPPREILVVANHRVSAAAARERLAEARTCGVPLRIVDGAGCKHANDARNLGARLAGSAWIALLDSDDWWAPDHLAACAAAVETAQAAAAPVDFVYGSIRVITARGEQLLRAEHFSTLVTPENYLLSYRPAQTSSFVVRRALMLAEPWASDLRRHQDYEWFARIARRVRVAVNPAADVNVEWLAERRHRAHRDCWSVVAPWRPRVRRHAFRRHHRNLIKSALKSHDPYALRLVWYYAADALRGERAFLHDAE